MSKEKEYSYSFNEERYYGRHSSIQEAVEEAYSDCEDCDGCWVGEVAEINLSNYVADRIDTLIELVEEDIAEETFWDGEVMSLETKSKLRSAIEQALESVELKAEYYSVIKAKFHHFSDYGCKEE